MRLIAVGDLAFNGLYHKLLAKGKRNPCREVGNWNDTDIVVGNLESPITTASRVAPAKCTLRGSEHAYKVLESHFFRVLSLANNHMMDFGVQGLEDTKRYLDHHGIGYCGAGSDLKEATAPLIIDQGDQRLGFLSFCDVEQLSHLYASKDKPGVAPLDTDACCKAITELRAEVDWVILQVHWGKEMSTLPTMQQLCRRGCLWKLGSI